MISVVIPLYNKEQSIASTLQTVLKQTYQDFEIVIVNDGSTDHSVEEVAKVLDPRIRLIHQKNAGVSATRNRGIEEARGEFVAFLDADDEWKPDYLKTQYELTQKYPECSVFASDYEFKDTYGKVTSTIIRKLPFKGVDGILSNYFEVASCSHPPLWTSAVMVKKSAIQSIGGFPVGIKSGEDLLTWARLAVKYKIAYSRKSNAIYFKLKGNAIELSKFIRKPEEPDIVGDSLKEILKTKEGIQYLSLWYKMRANLYYRSNCRYSTFKYALKALSYNPFEIKNYFYLCIPFLPKFFVAKLMGR